MYQSHTSATVAHFIINVGFVSTTRVLLLQSNPAQGKTIKETTNLLEYEVIKSVEDFVKDFRNLYGFVV